MLFLEMSVKLPINSLPVLMDAWILFKFSVACCDACSARLNASVALDRACDNYNENT